MITTQNRRGTAKCFDTTPLSSHPSPLLPEELFDVYIVKRITYQANQLAKHLGLDDDRRDDIEQDMRLELLQAKARFNRARTQWHTFASRVLDLYVKHFIRDEMLQRKHEPCPLPDDECSCDSDEGDSHVEYREEFAFTENFDEVALRVDTEEMLSQLPSKLREACELLMFLSPPEAARVLGIHRNSIYRIIANIRMHFLGENTQSPQNPGGKFATRGDIEGRGTSLNHHTEEPNVNA
jgi:hypothetical protein